MFILITAVATFVLFVLPGILLGAFLTSKLSTRRLEHTFADLIELQVMKIAPAFVISALYTGISAAVGSFLGTDCLASHWFSRESNGFALFGGSLGPTAMLPFLVCYNLPFDLVTILVSIMLLQIVKEKGKYIVFIALIDILISAILVILLHTTLKTIEPGGFSHIGQNFADSWNWFIQVVTFKASPSHPDWPLTPVLFTTFIPVTLYMSAFIFLGIIIKPFARVASHICGKLYEEEQTPFLAFSLILSGLLTVAKTLSEWQWFAHQIKQLLG